MRAAAGAIERRLAPLVDEPMPRAAEPYLVHYTRRAMACDFALFLNAGQYDHTAETALEALDLVEQLETQLTVYRDSSEVMAINRSAADGPVPVEAGLFRLLEFSLTLYAATDGAFDITAGPLTKAWGFSRRAGAIPDAATLAETLERVGGQYIELDAEHRTIRFRRPGIELNFGAIGKGYALDRCDELLRAAGIENFLWHGGQSSVLARGSSADSSERDGGWLVGVGDPVRAGRRVAEIWLRDRALATSGASAQFFRHQGRRYGHILDPRTGWPAEGVLSATVVAPTAAEADALSTAMYVMGVERALAFCGSRPDVGALLLHASPSGSNVEIATAGLRENEWRPV